jgi:FkbM family methyltransferase
MARGILQPVRRLARYLLKPTLQRIHARRTDPIRQYTIEGLALFAHANEYITTTFASYRMRPDTERYNDFFFVRLLFEQWGACNLVDVGVNYGQDLLLQAAYKQRQGIPGEILGFEPNSRTFALLEHTFRENAIPARFEHLALGRKAGSIILQGVKNESHGMTTVLGFSFPDRFEVVEVRTLDDAARHLLGQPCFLKLDTQGAEWLIWQGATAFRDKLDLVARAEFTPHATVGISGPELLDFYLQRYRVIDAKSNRVVRPEELREFCERVRGEYHYGYTDLYLVPKESPLSARL